MTPEELMKPRIKIIAHWPNMEEDFDSVVGEIIELPSDKWIYSDNEHCEENYFNDWPHLFQSIPWYAERNPEDMPEYVVTDYKDKFEGKSFLANGMCFRVEKWVVEKFDTIKEPQLLAYLEGYKPSYLPRLAGEKYGRVNSCHLLPATYEQYINSKQPT